MCSSSFVQTHISEQQRKGRKKHFYLQGGTFEKTTRDRKKHVKLNRNMSRKKLLQKIQVFQKYKQRLYRATFENTLLAQEYFT